MRATLVVVLLAGCNQLWELEPTKVEVPLDVDGDGVEDRDDNCRDVPNGQQTDADADGFGDACDGCDALPTTDNHDEDGDRIGDACDDCPGIADFGAAGDSDRDGIADPCESTAFPAPTRLVAFDPFLVLDESRWSGATVPWQVTGDAIAPVTTAPNDRLIRTDVSITSEAVTLEIGFRSTRPWQAGDRFGIGLVGAGGELVALCEMACGASCTYATSPNVPGAVPVPKPIARGRIRLLRSSTNLFCQFEENALVGGGSLAIAGTPAIFSTPAIEITHFAAWVDD